MAVQWDWQFESRLIVAELLAGELASMEARKLINGAPLGPEALKAVGQAFDEAWASITGSVGSDPVIVKAAHMRLATAVLSIADGDSRDVAALKDAALKAYEKTIWPAPLCLRRCR